MSRFPEECPVFEVIEDGMMMRAGAVVEGLGPAAHRFHRLMLPQSEHGWLAVRLLDDKDYLWAEVYAPYCKALVGYIGCFAEAALLRPLTRAAREMLALESL
jgi:hypothetical protein